MTVNCLGPIEFSDDGKTLTVRARFEIARLICNVADDTLQTIVQSEMVRMISEDSALQGKIRNLALGQLLKLAEKAV